MLKHVSIMENKTAKECEVEINRAVEEWSEYDVNYELLIENTLRVGDVTEVRYTLLINVEEVVEEK